MDLKTLLNLRPKADSAEAIRAAIAEAEAARAGAATRIAELQRARGARLLDDDGPTVARAEAALAAATAEADRLDALLPVLRDRHAAAELRERRAEAERLIADARRLSDSFAAWWGKDYAPLAGAIARGLLIEAEAEEALRRAAKALDDLGERGEGLPPLPATPSQRLWPNMPGGIFGIGATVSLPNPAGPPSHSAGPAIWPQGVA